jgi:hypothetical protein
MVRVENLAIADIAPRRNPSGSGDGFDSIITRASQNARSQTGRDQLTVTSPSRDRRDRLPTEIGNETTLNVSDGELAFGPGPDPILQPDGDFDIGEIKELVLDVEVLVDAIVGEVELLAEMANILNIAPEELKEILTDLEMPIDDLELPENRTLLLMKTQGMEKPVELLNYPDVLPVLGELTKVMENYAPTEDFALEAEMAEEGFLEIVHDVMEGEVAATESSTHASASEMPQISEITTADATPKFVEAMTQTFMPAVTNDAPPPQLMADIGTGTTMQNVSPSQIVQQIVQNVRFVTGEHMTEIRIQLKPENLGNLSMRIATINGIVTAQFIAESQRVKELIEAGFTDLRDSLQQAGIDIADIEVNVRSGDGGQNDFEDNDSPISTARLQEILANAQAEENQETRNQRPETAGIDYQI